MVLIQTLLTMMAAEHNDRNSAPRSAAPSLGRDGAVAAAGDPAAHSSVPVLPCWNVGDGR
jgi:hypothetical protein